MLNVFHAKGLAFVFAFFFGFGLNLYAMFQEVTSVANGANGANGAKSDPYGALAALIFGSFGMGALALWQQYAKAVDARKNEREKNEIANRAERDKANQAREIESRKAEMANAYDRINGQDKYIRELEDKFRAAVEEKSRWKTLWESSQCPVTMTTTNTSPATISNTSLNQPSSPKRSDPG